jgi:hypothetical protein
MSVPEEKPVKTPAAALLLALALSPAAHAADFVEPRTGVACPEQRDGMSLLGAGVRTRTFLKVKVYAICLYVSDQALAGPLAKHRGQASSPAFYRELVQGDFPKQVVMTFVREATAEQVRDAFYEALPSVDRAKLDLFSSHFGTPKKGDAYVLRWAPGGALEVIAAGQAKPPIQDRAFSTAVFGIWLGEKPLQEDIKRDLVARAPQALR